MSGTPDLVNFYAVVPIKEPRQGKSRLAPLLDDASRYALNLALARQTLDVCLETFGPGRTIVVTLSSEIAAIAKAASASVVAEPHGDIPPTPENALNRALKSGVLHALQGGASGVAIVPTDIPIISSALLRSALKRLADGHDCVLVPDRRQAGTNIMVMAPPVPGLVDFGEGSFARHHARARELGFNVKVHRCDMLGLDLDFPEDFQYLQEQHSWPIFKSTTSMPSESRLASTRM